LHNVSYYTRNIQGSDTWVRLLVQILCIIQYCKYFFSAVDKTNGLTAGKLVCLPRRWLSYLMQIFSDTRRSMNILLINNLSITSAKQLRIILLSSILHWLQTIFAIRYKRWH